MLITVILGTLHLNDSFERTRAYRDANPGILVHVPVAPRADVVLGAYRNSDGRRSSVAAVRYTLAQRGPWAASVTAGVVTGYGPRALPLVTPTVSYGGLNLSYVPSARLAGAPRGAQGINVSYTVAFGT